MWHRQHSGATWLCMRMPCVTHVYMCACVSVCACGCMNNEITHFLGFLLSHYVHMPDIHAHSLSFLSCVTMFLFLCVQVMWHCVEHPIA